MKDCTTCVWNVHSMFCLQGHVRQVKYKEMKADGYVPIQDCHAWKEKEKESKPCECGEEFKGVDLIMLRLLTPKFNLVCRKCGRVIE